MSSSPTLIMNPTRGEEEEEMLAIGRGRSHTPPPGSRPSSRIEILLMDLVRSQAETARSTELRFENLARAQSEQSKSTKEQIEGGFGGLARSQAEQSRSTEGRLENLARSQAEQSRSTEGKLESLARSQAEQSRSTEGKLESLARSRAEQSQSTKAQIDEITRGCAEQLANMMGRLSSLEVTRHGTPSPNPGRRGSPSSAETMHVSVPSTDGDLVPLSQAEVRRSERLMLKPRPDYRLLNRS